MENLSGFEINGVSFLVKTTEGDYGMEYKTYQFCGQKVSLEELQEIVEAFIRTNEMLLITLFTLNYTKELI